MNSTSICIKEQFGWKKISDANHEFYFSGYAYNYNISELFNELKNINIIGIKELINNIDGQFAFVFKSEHFTFMSVDKIRSIPLFYLYDENNIYIDSNAENLRSIKKLTYKDVDKEQLLCFEMSGYTLGNKTLYKKLLSLKAGELVIFDNDNTKKIIYNRFEPWKVTQNNYNEYIKELSEVTLSIFNKMIKNLNGRQVVIPLSAGNDSRLVASCLKNLGYENVLCYSYGTKGNFETTIAEKISKKLEYKFVNIVMSHKKEKEYYALKEYQNFLKFADTCSSIQFIQSISTIKYLNENNLIDKDAVFINGNSGDFISGGHILGKVQEDNYNLDKEKRIDIILDQIIKKHFMLWGYLKNDKNISNIKKLLKNELIEENIDIELTNEDHGIYEYLEFINRQSKYVITGQRVYEFYNYEWRLPLWDDEYLEFWEKVPKEYKVNQKLYKDMLKLTNFEDVWTDNIPVNRYDIVPKWIVPIRFIAKVPFMLFGSYGKPYWHQFEISFFQYWTDVIHMSNSKSYTSMVTSFFKKPRNVLSLITKDYVKKLKESYE